MGEKIATRGAFGKAIVELAEQYPELVVLDADLSGSTMSKKFADVCPERFYNIGIAETLNAAYRNENICVFVVNNNNFGMTGGQMSWCTMEGQKTATSPHGRDCALTGYPIKVPEMIAHSFKPAYVARGAITTPQEINKLKGYIRNAFQAQLNHEGYSLVEVLSTCPTNWAMSPLAAHKRLTEEVAPYYELGEFKKRGE